jgi:hypothetical protein
MNISSNRLFPYPVLWFVNDDYRDSDFSVQIEESSTIGKLSLKYHISLENGDIQKMIDEGVAAFCIHIECPLTMYRHNHLTSSKSGTIDLRIEEINHRLEILPMVIALEDIRHYWNQDLNEDYRDTDIILTKGSIIAIADQYHLNIDKEKNDLGKKESIFSIVKGAKDESMQIEIMGDRITIKLKEEDFRKFQLLKHDKYKPVIFSILIIPALIYALDAIGNSESKEEMESIADFNWFRSLERCFQAMGFTLDANTVQNKTSYALAQMLLDHPISDAITFLNDWGDK